MLTRYGQPTVRLVPVERKRDRAEVRVALEAMCGLLEPDGVSAARSQDFLYDEHGLPA